MAGDKAVAKKPPVSRYCSVTSYSLVFISLNTMDKGALGKKDLEASLSIHTF